MKIDVEGAEREVLDGALEALATHRPIVVFEH
ncbi:MAG: Methyltransferase FkbM domain, partial [Solirubrobacteraceae bacterium]|nr:Methyltransferase FkbM domain [Solirubrobacteraceae bacterium]